MAILNNSPVLSLSDIIVQLFDNKLLADVQFACDNKVIYAHSFLLMSRSVVYETKFRKNQGIQKLIPIQNYVYKSFYQFVRFIYTDECTITRENMMELLELSIKYKIPKLENLVIAFIIHCGDQLTLMEKFRIYVFCATENYELMRNWISTFIGPLLLDIIKSNSFVKIEPHILETILKMDYMGTALNPIKEVDLFKALINWMNHYCTKNGLALSERRVKFDRLIQLIRFPVMVFAELTDCIQQSNNLFTDSDFVTFFKPGTSSIWNCKARQLFNAECITNYPQQSKPLVTFINNTNFSAQKKAISETETIARLRDRIQKTTHGVPQLYSVPKYGMPAINHSALQLQAFQRLWNTTNNQNTKACQTFEITENLVFTGLRINSSNVKSIQVTTTNPTFTLLNIELIPNQSSEIIVSLGESYLLRPKDKYRIEIKNSKTSTVQSGTVTKDKKINLVHEEFCKYYKELERDNRLIEFFFKLAENV